MGIREGVLQIFPEVGEMQGLGVESTQDLPMDATQSHDRTGYRQNVKIAQKQKIETFIALTLSLEPHVADFSPDFGGNRGPIVCLRD